MGVKTIAGESGGIDWLASVGPQSNGFEFNFRVRVGGSHANLNSKTSPFNGAFFSRVDLGQVGSLAEEKTFDVVEQEVLGVRVG